MPSAIDLVVQLVPVTARVADQGCGRLRHLGLLRRAFRDLLLVDTEVQLARQTLIGRRATSVRRYVELMSKRPGGRIQTMPAEGFSRARLQLDCVFSIATLDVLPPRARTDVLRAGVQNLRRGGLYCLIIPRNDSSILRRCTADRAFHDGFAFPHHGAATFYKNFRDVAPLIARLRRMGLTLVRDFSKYRQAALLLRKA